MLLHLRMGQHLPHLLKITLKFVEKIQKVSLKNSCFYNTGSQSFKTKMGRGGEEELSR
jgi:hypothetical protein